eukprot:scaffold13230_cov98-Isochrysis_galbana.AAC.7
MPAGHIVHSAPAKAPCTIIVRSRGVSRSRSLSALADSRAFASASLLLPPCFCVPALGNA